MDREAQCDGAVAAVNGLEMLNVAAGDGVQRVVPAQTVARRGRAFLCHRMMDGKMQCHRTVAAVCGLEMLGVVSAGGV